MKNNIEFYNNVIAGIVENFSLYNPTLYNNMITETHSHIDENNNIVMHNHHIEDSIWTHTMLSLQSYCLTDMKNDNLVDAIAKCFMIFCHDLGKVKAKKFKEEKNKNIFYSHDVYSVVETIDFIDFCIKNGFFTSLYIDSYIHDILKAISWHMKFRDLPSKSIYQFDIEYDFLSTMIKHDARFYNPKYVKTNNEELPIVQTKKSSDNKFFNLDKTKIIFVCGVPGVGKDTFANKFFPERKLLSLDNIRIDLALKNLYIPIGATESDIYDIAFNYCRNMNVEDILVDNIIESINNNEDLIICNTLINSKSRKKLLTKIKQKNKSVSISALMLVAPKYIIFDRLEKRKSKNIQQQIAEDFINRIEIPSEFEGFDFTTTILNY